MKIITISRLIKFAILSLGSLYLAGCDIPKIEEPPAYPPQCTDTVDRSSPLLSNGFGFDLGNTRNQASGLDASNVENLSLGLAHAAYSYPGKRGAPAVTEQAIFFSSGLDIVAMNRTSGCVYWSTRGDEVPPNAILGHNIMRSSSILYINDNPDQPALIIAGDNLGTLYAFNAETGDILWKRFIGTDEKHHWVTGGFQYYDGALYVPVGSKEAIVSMVELPLCCNSHGLLQKVDAYTGETIWTYHTTAEPSFQVGAFHRGPNGATIWSVPAIDPERNTVYVGTGQNFTPPITDTSDAIIALNMDDGSERWIFQAYDDDAWTAACEIPIKPFNADCVQPAGHDFEFGAPPMLVQLADGNQSVIAGSKGGGVYSLNPDTGELNWHNQVGVGSALGGIHWGMAADDHRVYVPVADAFVNKTSGILIIRSLLNGTQVQPLEGGAPGIHALNLITGETEWYVSPQHLHKGERYTSIFSAAISVTNDILFAGSLDGHVIALSSRDGEELWRYDSSQPFVDVAGISSHGGAIDSVGPIPAGDTLILNSGYSNFGGVDAYQAGPGNGLLIFRPQD